MVEIVKHETLVFIKSFIKLLLITKTRGNLLQIISNFPSKPCSLSKNKQMVLRERLSSCHAFPTIPKERQWSSLRTSIGYGRPPQEISSKICFCACWDPALCV